MDPQNKLPPMVFKRYLIVRRAPFKTQGVEMSKTKVIKNCCSTVGTTTFSCYFEQQAYDPTGVARVAAYIDNTKMKKEAAALKIKLKRNIEAQADGHSFRDTLKLTSKTEKGIDAYKAEGRTLELNLSEIAEQSKFTLQARRQHKGEYSEEDQALAQLMQPTVSTRLIRCEYILEVVLDFTGCCAADPTLKLPLIIFAPQIHRQL